MSLLLRSLLGISLLFAAGAASAQNDTRALQDRLQRLERDLQSLQAQVSSGAGARPGGPVGAPGGDGSMTSTLLARIGQLEQDQRTLTGQVEEVGFSVGQLKQRLDRLVTDMEFRLSELEKKQSEQGAAPVAAAPAARPGAPAVAGAAPQAAPGGPTLGSPPRNLGSISAADERAMAERAAAQGAQTANVASPPPGRAAPAAAATSTIRLPPGTPRDQYDYAFDLLKQGKYADAEQAMRQFVQAYPQDALSGNAQYWLGETFYVRNNHTEAAVQFMQGYQRYPQSPKAPDNLFKLGMSLASLDRKPEACAAFGRFNTEYPGAPGALKQRVQEERRRLACG